MALRTKAVIENALRDWAIVVHPSATVIFVQPDAPRPDLPYITIDVQGVDPVGFDEPAAITLGTDPDHSQEIQGDRTVNVEVNAYGSGAMDLVRELASSIWRRSVSQGLLADGLAARLPGPVNDLTGLLETSHEQRAQVSMVFGIREDYTDTVAVIEIVDGDGDVVHPDSSETNVEVDANLAVP